MKPDYNAEIKEIKTKCVSKVLLKKMIQNVYEYLDKGLLSQTETENIIHSLEHRIDLIDNLENEHH